MKNRRLWQSHTITALVLAVVVIPFWLVAPLASAQVYEIRDLGTMLPAAINDAGQIAGVNHSCASLPCDSHAVRWTAGHVEDLGLLPGGTYSVPTAINTVGAVVGAADSLLTIEWCMPGPTGWYPDPCIIYSGPGWDYSHPWTGNISQGFVWTRSGGMKSLGYIDNPWRCFSPSYAEGINIFGQIVEMEWGCSYTLGFEWTEKRGLAEILPFDYNNEAKAINNRGQLVGWNGVSQTGESSCSPEGGINGGARPSLWENGVLTELGSPPTVTPGCENLGIALDINDAGQIVGQSLVSPSVYHAFLWTRSNGMEDLGTLPGDLWSIAKKINGFGQVIGSSYRDSPYEYPPEQGRPFIWTRKTGMLDLNTLIDSDSGWTLQSVAGINLRGQIVGQGTVNGETHGFLLTPRKGRFR